MFLILASGLGFPCVPYDIIQTVQKVKRSVLHKNTHASTNIQKSSIKIVRKKNLIEFYEDYRQKEVTAMVAKKDFNNTKKNMNYLSHSFGMVPYPDLQESISKVSNSATISISDVRY